MGVVSPAGTGLDAFWQGLRTTPADRRERTVDDFDPSPWLSGKQARHLDRFTRFAVAAGQMALDDAGACRSTRPGWGPARHRHRRRRHAETQVGVLSRARARAGVPPSPSRW
jgi:3-oxoacyl-(acyl-carrier-protein) synthase